VPDCGGYLATKDSSAAPSIQPPQPAAASSRSEPVAAACRSRPWRRRTPPKSRAFLSSKAPGPYPDPDWKSIFADISAPYTGAWMPHPKADELKIGDSIETPAGPRHVIGKRAGLVKLGT
jgi:hypothetical protein